MNIGHCPETSKDANGLNRYYRIKVLLNVAEWFKTLRYTVPKLLRVEKVVIILSWRYETFF